MVHARTSSRASNATATATVGRRGVNGHHHRARPSLALSEMSFMEDGRGGEEGNGSGEEEEERPITPSTTPGKRKARDRLSQQYSPSSSSVVAGARPSKRSRLSSTTGVAGPVIEEKPLVDVLPDLSSLEAGEVFVSGSGEVGQLGLGEDVLSKSRPAAVKFFLDKDPVKVAAGSQHNLVLLRNHQVWSWGCNDEGALGRSTPENEQEMVPGQVEGLDGLKIVDIQAGDNISVVLTRQGQVYAWGTFRTSEGSRRFSPALERAHRATLVDGFEGAQIVKIACGGNHVIAMDTDSKIWTWGEDESGQLMRRLMTRRTGSFLHLLPARATTIRKRAKVVDIATGAYSSYVIYSNGSVQAAGLNNYGQVSAIPPWLDIIHIAAGEHHAILQNRHGDLYGIGRADSGQLGLSQSLADSTGSSIREAAKITLKVREDEDNDDHEEVTAAIGKVYASGFWSAAIGQKGQLFTWGYGDMGQLAIGQDKIHALPTKVELKTRRAIEVGCGTQHLIALLSLRQ